MKLLTDAYGDTVWRVAHACGADEAGLSRDTRFHDLCHTAATLLLASGVNVKVVSEMLGHSSVSITLSVYAHVLPHMQQPAVHAMDQLLVAPAIADLPERNATKQHRNEFSSWSNRDSLVDRRSHRTAPNR